MFFVTKNSGSDFDVPNAKLIGIHDSYIYTARMSENGIIISRKKDVEVAEWQDFTAYEYVNWKTCDCVYGISAACGFIFDKIFIVTYGVVSFVISSLI